jgi:TGF-beta propeptide
MRLLALLLLVISAVALSTGTASAGTATVSIRPAADLGLPFWCDWSYDWEARCYRDDGPRLPVGGVDDKVWRSAVRFPLQQIPELAAIVSARLHLYHDGTCAPRLETVRCGARSYAADAHRILSADWFDEREPDTDGRVEATGVLSDSRTARWLSWDVTGLVQDWYEGAQPNYGLLLKLSEEEDFGVSGPAFASSAFAEAWLRPRLVVTYTTG